MKKNILDDIPEQLKVELFSNLHESEHFRVERIVSKGHASDPEFWYDQAQSEWIMMIEGAACLELEGKGELHLKKGDYLNIPARLKHRVKWTEPNKETVWLAIHYHESLNTKPL